MSQITKIAMCCLLIVGGLMVMTGCGSSKSNSNANNTFNTDSQQHPSGWLPAGHMVDAATGTTRTDVSVCAECHGENYKGGVAGVSCTQCHLGDEKTKHPLDWGADAPIKHGPYVGTSGTPSHGNTACSNVYCHGTDRTGVTDSGPSCTSCHMGSDSAIHPLAWTNSASADHRDYVLQNPSVLTKCSNADCHGSDFLGVTGSGPSCKSCHPEPFYDCTACHGQPPATGHHVFHITQKLLVCKDCHVVTAATHDNGVVNLVSTITYTASTKSCTPSCHATKTW